MEPAKAGFFVGKLPVMKECEDNKVNLLKQNPRTEIPMVDTWST
jgi:hypothetical protein